MTNFLWVVVILMSVALLAEMLAFVGMALVARRAARRAREITGEISQRVKASAELVEATKRNLAPHMQSLVADSAEMKAVLASRLQSLNAARQDAARRASRLRLRLGDSVQTVGQQQQAQRGSYREVVESVQEARKVLRGISLALWLLRKVA